MKDYKWPIGFFGFLLGFVSIYFWNKAYYVKIPKQNINRAKASGSNSQQKTIDDFTQRILNIESKKDVDEVVRYIIDRSKEEPKQVGVQLFGMAAKTVPMLKGIFWRMRGIVDETDITHTAILSRLRFIYFNRYTYGPHIRALFHYVTDPVDHLEQYQKISQVQDDMYNVLRPQLANMLELAKKSMSQPARDFQFSLDRRVFVGQGDGKRFFDPEEAQKEFIKPHMSYVISGLARVIGTIDYVSNYHLDDLVPIMRAVLKKSAINQVKGRMNVKSYIRQKLGLNSTYSLPQIMTRKDIFAIVKSYDKFMKPRYEAKIVNDRKNDAFEMFQLAANHDLYGYTCTISMTRKMIKGEAIKNKYPCDKGYMQRENFVDEEFFMVGGKDYLINPNKLLIMQKQKYHELSERSRVYNSSGPETIISDVTGKSVRIDIKKAFTYKEDLKDYLPTDYDLSIDYDDIKIENAKGKHIDKKWAWNYNYGRPISWSDPSFGGLFPDASNRNIYDLMYTVKLTRSLRPFGNLFTTVP